MAVSLTVDFSEGRAHYRGVDSYGFPVWHWSKRIPNGKLVPGKMPKSVVRRIERHQAQVADV